MQVYLIFGSGRIVAVYKGTLCWLNLLAFCLGAREAQVGCSAALAGCFSIFIFCLFKAKAVRLHVTKKPRPFTCVRLATVGSQWPPNSVVVVAPVVFVAQLLAVWPWRVARRLLPAGEQLAALGTQLADVRCQASGPPTLSPFGLIGPQTAKK